MGSNAADYYGLKRVTVGDMNIKFLPAKSVGYLFHFDLYFTSSMNKIYKYGMYVFLHKQTFGKGDIIPSLRAFPLSCDSPSSNNVFLFVQG